MCFWVSRSGSVNVLQQQLMVYHSTRNVGWATSEGGPEPTFHDASVSRRALNSWMLSLSIPLRSREDDWGCGLTCRYRSFCSVYVWKQIVSEWRRLQVISLPKMVNLLSMITCFSNHHAASCCCCCCRRQSISTARKQLSAHRISPRVEQRVRRHVLRHGAVVP